MKAAHGNQPVAAVQRRTDHHVGARFERVERPPQRPAGKTRNVAGDQRDRPRGDVTLHRVRERVLEASALLKHELDVGARELPELRRVGRVRVQESDAISGRRGLRETRGERVEQQGSAERRRLVR